MAIVIILNQRINVKNQEIIDVLNLKLHQFISWLNIGINRKSEYASDIQKIVTLLKNNKIIYKEKPNDFQWKRTSTVDRDLILTEHFIREECFAERFIKTARQLNTHSCPPEYVNEYCDDSWDPNDVLLGS